MPNPTAARWRVRTRTLSTVDHTLIMGILNVTPDSFSDGGRFSGAVPAIAAGRRLAAAGADIVDVGGESTRPGAAEVEPAMEIERVVPVVRGLAESGIVVSVDTSKAAVAAAAIAAGAEIVNDVTALRDPDMAPVCAGAGVGVVVMHMQGTPRTMQQAPRYDDVVSEVRSYLLERAAWAQRQGIDGERLCLDPGIGFGKTLEHNLALLGGLAELAGTGYPLLVGASRKRFLGAVLAASGIETSPGERDTATAATTALAIAAGCAVIRVHDVAGTLEVARIADAIVRSRAQRQDQGTE